MRVAEIGPAPSASSGTRVSPMPRASARVGEEIGAAAAAAAEGEVRAANQVAGAEALVQHLGHEGLGRTSG